MTSAVEHHAEMGRYAREDAATFRRYLSFSRDTDQRRWAEAMAAAAELRAIASETYADILRARTRAAVA